MSVCFSSLFLVFPLQDVVGDEMNMKRLLKKHKTMKMRLSVVFPLLSVLEEK